MKKLLFIYGLIGLTALSCSKDEVPEEINEEELITTIEVALSSAEGNVTLAYRDLDADGPQPPTISVSGPLKSGVRYVGAITFLNESESPAEDITEEVKEEDLKHQFFYTIGTGLDVTTAYSEEPGTGLDSEGNFLGVKFTLTAGAESSGSLTFTLRHEPTKPNTGLVDAEGETDIEVAFDIEVVELG